MMQDLSADAALCSVDAYLWSLARRYHAWNAPAEDLFQEACIAFVRAYPRYNPARAKLTTFASVHGLSGIRRFLRDKARLIRKPAYLWEAGDRDDTTFSFTDAFQKEERQEVLSQDPRNAIEHKIFVEQILSNLTFKEARVMRLHLEGLTDGEIGARFGIVGQSVMDTRHRALKKLRENGAMLALM